LAAPAPWSPNRGIIVSRRRAKRSRLLARTAGKMLNNVPYSAATGVRRRAMTRAVTIND
jgi:hypothetical protein